MLWIILSKWFDNHVNQTLCEWTLARYLLLQIESSRPASAKLRSRVISDSGISELKISNNAFNDTFSANSFVFKYSMHVMKLRREPTPRNSVLVQIVDIYYPVET